MGPPSVVRSPGSVVQGRRSKVQGRRPKVRSPGWAVYGRMASGHQRPGREGAHACLCPTRGHEPCPLSQRPDASARPRILPALRQDLVTIPSHWRQMCRRDGTKRSVGSSHKRGTDRRRPEPEARRRPGHLHNKVCLSFERGIWRLRKGKPEETRGRKTTGLSRQPGDRRPI
jgi:hypothetical protein